MARHRKDEGMILGREVAVWVAFFKVVLYGIGLFYFDLTDPIQMAIIAVIAAALNVLAAWKTLHTSLGLVFVLMEAAVGLAVILGLPWTEAQQAGLLAIVGALLSLFQRTQTSPLLHGTFNSEGVALITSAPKRDAVNP
jgi:hypothetical protein